MVIPAAPEIEQFVFRATEDEQIIVASLGMPTSEVAMSARKRNRVLGRARTSFKFTLREKEVPPLLLTG